MNFFTAFFVILLVGSDMLVLSLIHKLNAKKCSYDCSKCKNWDCMATFCDKKRSSL